MDRRTAVCTVASSLTLPVIGCLGSSNNGAETTTSSESVREHGATYKIETQPTIGPHPLDGGSVIIAFEDPSCPPCRRFELNVFPKIREEWIEQGKISFVYRGIPIVYEWGRPAIAALEGTYAQDADAFWTLKKHYYENQDGFTTENIRERTRTALKAKTGVDVDRVMSGIDAGRYDDAIEVDMEAADRANIGSTPTFALFKQGSYLTLIHGSHSFEVFESALDL